MNIKIVFPTCVCAVFDDEEAIIQDIKKILKDLNINGTVEAIRDLDKSLELGVMNPPALIINEKIVSTKTLPTIEKIRFYIENMRVTD